MYANKTKKEILDSALRKLKSDTQITSLGPGSIARAITETIVDEIGDLYSAMDYNISMTMLSTASGQALDMMGELYSVRRKKLGSVASQEQIIESFIFYLDSTHSEDIQIPAGTRVFTDADNFIGDSYMYMVTESTILPAGRTRTFAKIRPMFSDSVFTAGEGMITRHNLDTPEGVDLKCTNLKPISQQVGYESDDNYRRRIVAEIKVAAGGTVEALRFKGLSVPNVRDIKVKSGRYGPGTASVLVVLDNRTNSNVSMQEITRALNEVKPVGVKLFIREPEYDVLDLTANIVVRDLPDINANGTAERATQAIRRHLNTLLPDDTLRYAHLTQAVLDASDVIRDVTFTTLQINFSEIQRINYKPKDGHQIVPGDIRVVPRLKSN